MPEYEVIVGNIGTVTRTENEYEALQVFTEYVEQSNHPFGRASGEEVTLMKDGEPEQTHYGRLLSNS